MKLTRSINLQDLGTLSDIYLLGCGQEATVGTGLGGWEDLSKNSKSH